MLGSRRAACSALRRPSSESPSSSRRTVNPASRRKSGFHIGAFAPYGYKKDPEQRGRLLIDEEAAAVVREIFTLFSQGYGKTAIARLLNERGIPNPTEYKRLHGLRYQQPKGKTGALWKYAAISGILTNELYIGNMVQGRYGSVSYKAKQNKPQPREMWYRVEGTHKAIIDRDLWDRVQALSASRAKPFLCGTVGLFARKVRCASCGYTMRSTKSRGKHYLQCTSRRAARDACPGAFISVDTLERLVIQELNSLSQRYLDQEELVRRVACVQSVHQQRERILRDVHVEHLTREMVEHFIDCIIVGKRLPETRNVPVEIHWNF